MSDFNSCDMLLHQNTANGEVCISTNQVYDSCMDRDCIKDARVFFSEEVQEIVNRAINIKVKSAEIVWVYSNVEEMPFNKGFYTVDIKYFINVRLDIFSTLGVPQEINGLSVYDKKVILFGSEGKTKSFTSKFNPESNISEIWEKNNLPEATVQVVDPIALSVRFAQKEECCCCCSASTVNIPKSICGCYGGNITTEESEKNVLVTLGLFSVVKLERNVELKINSADFCVPKKQCNQISEENPCKIFETISFPVDEFYPPRNGISSNENDGKCGCGCE